MTRVLIVEDDPDNAQLLQIWVAGMGYEVLAASSAVQALQVLEEHGIPDVAVVDIVMADISGLALVEHLRRHEPLTVDMPTILLTARHLVTDPDQASALGATLMTKPLRRAELGTAIEAALHQAGTEGDPDPGGAVGLPAW